MRLEVLGCAGGIGTGGQTTALLLDEDCLLDCGTGVTRLSLERLKAIRHVLLTHAHMDHIATLPLLLDAVLATGHPGVTVHAHPETIAALRAHLFNGALWPDFSRIPAETPILRYREISPGGTLDLGGHRQVTALPAHHSVPALGWMVDDGQHAFCFSGDCGPQQAFWEALNAQPRLDLLIVELGYPRSQHSLAAQARHYEPQGLVDDLIRLRHRPQIYLTHFKPGFEAQIAAEFTALATERLPHLSVAKPLSSGDVFTYPDG